MFHDKDKDKDKDKKSIQESKYKTIGTLAFVQGECCAQKLQTPNSRVLCIARCVLLIVRKLHVHSLIVRMFAAHGMNAFAVPVLYREYIRECLLRTHHGLPVFVAPQRHGYHGLQWHGFFAIVIRCAFGREHHRVGWHHGEHVVLWVIKPCIVLRLLLLLLLLLLLHPRRKHRVHDNLLILSLNLKKSKDRILT